MSTSALTLAIQNYTEAVKNRSSAGGAGSESYFKELVNETQRISAGGTYTYDIKQIFPTEWGMYNFNSVNVVARILDEVSGSPTQGYFLNAEGLLSIGINAEGKIRIHNHSKTLSAQTRIYATIALN